MGEKSEDESLNDTMELMGWLEDLDQQLMRDVIKPNETCWAVYQYFDSAPWKPLNPREFLQFWRILTDEEKLMVLLEIG